MRLFIAITLDKAAKQSLEESIQALKNCSISGNFTRLENLHLTVIFIGETENVKSVCDVMDKVNAPPLNIAINCIGKFDRAGGNIYWAGVDGDDTLFKIYRQLCENLSGAGFNIKNQKYLPHITLGRQVVLSSEPDFSPDKITVSVGSLTLMESKRINGKLIYIPVYSKKLV